MPDEPTVLRWETLTKSAFDRLDRGRCVVLVTCSPLEVHGPHLPLGADALEGDGLAERLLRFLPERHRSRTFLRLPFVYAATDVVPQPGSLFFRPGTTMAFLEDLGASLAAQGFRDVLVSNFHGGPRHFVALEQACERVSRRRAIRMVSVFSLVLKRLAGKGGETLEGLLGSIPGCAWRTWPVTRTAVSSRPRSSWPSAAAGWIPYTRSSRARPSTAGSPRRSAGEASCRWAVSPAC